MSDRRIVTLVPKAGRGLVTARSRHNLGELVDSFAAYKDVIVNNGNWRVRLGELISPFPEGTGAVWGVHFYNSVDTSGPSSSPTTVLLYVAGPNAGTVNLIYWDLTGGFPHGVLMSVASPYELCFLTVKNRCFIAGMNNTPSIFQRYPSQQFYSWGKEGGTSDLAYTPYTNAINAATKVYFFAGDISGGAGNVNWTSAGNHFDNSGAWIGKTLLVEGITYTIATVPTTGTMTTTTSKVAAVAAKDFKVFYGNLNWTDFPPKYSYAYYNPDTGHVTNGGPVLTLTEKNMTNVNVELLAIPGTNDPYYTRIVLFRTAEDGGDLFPLKLDVSHGGTATVNATDFMIENTYVGTKTYRDGQPDVRLGEVLGYFVMPTTNNPPPTMRFTAYWDGRIWFVDPERPWELGFSGSPTQNPLGVPEESFPARNRIPIPGDDGFITAIHAVGADLLVGSARYLYFVQGSSESDYRLKRVSSRALAVGHWAIDEHPGDTTEESASAIYIGDDRRLWQQFPGGRCRDIGAPIQDKLDLVPKDVSRPFFVKVGQSEKSWICALGFMNAAKTRYSFYFYDFDNDQWYDWGFDAGVQPGWSITYGTSYPLAIGMLLWGSNTAANFGTFGEVNFVGTPTPAVLKTQHIDFGDALAKKVLEDVVLYVDDTSADWIARIAFDGGDSAAGDQLEFGTFVDTPRYKGPGVLHMTPKTAQAYVGRQFSTLQLRVSIPSAATSVLHHVAKVHIVVKLASSGISGLP